MNESSDGNNKTETKPVLCIDFDDIINNYQDATIVSGFFDWVERVRHDFRITLYSKRAATNDGVVSMATWLHTQRAAWIAEGNRKIAPLDPFTFEFVSTKPMAWMNIDGRSVSLRHTPIPPPDGDGTLPKALLNFKPRK